MKIKWINKVLLGTSMLALSASTSVFTVISCGSTAANNFIAQTYAIDSYGIDELSINVRDREVNITPSTSNEIKIAYASSDLEYYNISISNNELLMDLEYNKEWFDFVGTKPAKQHRIIDVEIPSNLLLNMHVATTNEKISCSSLDVQDSLTMTNNGGDIDFSNLGISNSLLISNKNGNIKGSVSGSFDEFIIMCEIKKGISNLPLSKETGTKHLDINCNNGDVDVQFIK